MLNQMPSDCQNEYLVFVLCSYSGQILVNSRITPQANISLPYFKRSENRIGAGDDRYRGREGPYRVTDFDERNHLSDAFIAGAVSLGIPHNPELQDLIQKRSLMISEAFECWTAFRSEYESHT